MKTVVIGDIHGRSTWKLIVHTEQPDRVIFIGDYFDSFDIPGLDQIHNFKEIIEYKETPITKLTPEQLKELGLTINVDVTDCKNFKEASKVQDQIINGDIKINIIKK